MSLVTTNIQETSIEQCRHPGELLAEELVATSMSVAALSRETGIPQPQLADIVESRRDITADIALRLANHFGTSARFWLNRQAAYERMRRRGPVAALAAKSQAEPPRVS